MVRLEHLGDQTRLHLKVSDHDVITLTDAHSPLNPGDTIRIAAHAPLYFDADGARIN